MTRALEHRACQPLRHLGTKGKMNNASENRHILLQHRRTHMYFVRNADWTSDPACARDFVTMQAALVFSRSHGMADAQLVVHFDRPGLHDLVLPLGCDEPLPIRAAA
jgi:hypothetical protein